MNEAPHTRQDEQAQRIAYLVAGFIQEKLTAAEHDELDAWVEASDENMKLFEELTDEKNIQQNLEWMHRTDTNARLQQVKTRLNFSTPLIKKRFNARHLFAAAAVLVLLMAGAWFLYNPNKQQQVQAIPA